MTLFNFVPNIKTNDIWKQQITAQWVTSEHSTRLNYIDIASDPEATEEVHSTTSITRKGLGIVWTVGKVGQQPGQGKDETQGQT